MQVNFKSFCILIAFSFTFLLFIAMASLFFVPNPIEVLSSLQTEEMIYSLKLSIITSAISTVIVLALAIPIGYSLARFSVCVC